jgi:exonuclease III
MKLISWNVANRVNVDHQAQALFERLPDVVALQEVSAGRSAIWRDAFATAGLGHIRSTRDSPAQEPSNSRACGVLIASRYPLRDQPSASVSAPWAEKSLSVIVVVPVGELQLHNVHVPNGSANKVLKIETLEAVFAVLSCQNGSRHFVLCGDFNAPQRELPSGQIVTWGQNGNSPFRLKGKVEGVDGHRWDRGERRVLSDLHPFGLRDVYRSHHGHARDACSFVLKKKEKEWPRRFDHIIASERLETVNCEYMDSWRTNRLSDHAAIEWVFKMSAGVTEAAGA